MRTKLILEAATLGAVLLLLAVTWPINRAILHRNIGSEPSGVVLEWTVRKPDREPVHVTLELMVGETDEQWQARLKEALQRVEAIR